VAFNGNSAADTQVTYTYKVTNSGDPLTNVTVSDDKLGIIADSLSLATGEEQEFIEMADILETTTNTVTVTGSLVDGTQCSDTAEATVTVEEPPAACTSDTKVGGITFMYTSDSCSATTNDQEGKAECSGPAPGEPVSIVVTRDADKVTASPNTGIFVGDTVSFTHTDGKFGAETKFDVVGSSGTQSLNIHTSCSKALAVGDQFGSMKVIDLQLIPK